MTVSLPTMSSTVGRRGAMMALFCAALAPLVVAGGLAASIATETSWAFVPAIPVFAVLDRLSARFVDAFDAETGASSVWYAWGSRDYLRHYAERAGVDWRLPAGVAWLGVGLLAGFFVFLCVYAVWDFARAGVDALSS